MQTTEQIIEPGWHQFSIPPYPAGTRPHLYCWCGGSVELAASGGVARTSSDLERFLHEHAACWPDEAWLLERSA